MHLSVWFSKKKHSTDICLSFLNDKIFKDFDKGMMTGIILIDLKKAFDSIDHDLFLEKLYAIGFSSVLVIGLSLISPADLFCLI